MRKEELLVVQQIREMPDKKLPIFEVLPKNDKIVKEIKKQIKHPYFQTILKTNRLAKILKIRTNKNIDNIEKNDLSMSPMLFLSEEEGGFPRRGYAIKINSKIEEHPYGQYVDLVVNEKLLEIGILSIFAHELGHLTMESLVESLDLKDTKTHMSMEVSDFNTAFYEGWGIHFQRMCYDFIPFIKEGYESTWNSDVAIKSMWHSAMDEYLRLEGVKRNKYVFKKCVEYSKKDLYDRFLEKITSPVFSNIKLKNGHQMLASEGVIATIFYRIVTDKILQQNCINSNFCDDFTLEEKNGPFTPFENVYLKILYLFNKYLGSNFDNSRSPMIILLKGWMETFPKDKERVVAILLQTTHGKTATNVMSNIAEEIAYLGQTGDIEGFIENLQLYNKSLEELKRKILSGELKIDENVGPEIWIYNENFLVPDNIFTKKRNKPLAMNLNSATPIYFEIIPHITKEMAEKIVNIRDKYGPFESIYDFFERVDIPETSHNFILERLKIG